MGFNEIYSGCNMLPYWHNNWTNISKFGYMTRSTPLTSIVILILITVVYLNAGGQDIQPSLYTMPEPGLPLARSLNAAMDVSPKDIGIFAFNKKGVMYYIDSRKPEHYGKLYVKNGNLTDSVQLLPFMTNIFPKLPLPKEDLPHNLGTITIDDANNIYIIYYTYVPYDDGLKKWKARIPILLFAKGGSLQFSSYRLPGNPDHAFLETRMNKLSFKLPPLIGVTDSKGPVIKNTYAVNTLSIILPVITGNNLTLNKQIKITDRSPGTSNHTGGYSSVATQGTFSYIAYNKINTNGTNNDLFIDVIDRNTNRKVSGVMAASVLPKIPDPHVTPVIVFGKTGQLHFISGSHGFSFTHIQYETNDTKLVRKKVNTLKGNRVYASLIADAAGNLTLVYDDYDPQPSLYLQQYNAAAGRWGTAVKLVSPPTSHKKRSKDNYGIYYFRLGITPVDEPLISLTFWNTYETRRYPRFCLTYNRDSKSWIYFR